MAVTKIWRVKGRVHKREKQGKWERKHKGKRKHNTRSKG